MVYSNFCCLRNKDYYEFRVHGAQWVPTGDFYRQWLTTTFQSHWYNIHKPVSSIEVWDPVKNSRLLFRLDTFEWLITLGEGSLLVVPG